MAMVVSEEETFSGLEGDTGLAYPILCTPPPPAARVGSHTTQAPRSHERRDFSFNPNGTVCRNVSQ